MIAVRAEGRPSERRGRLPGLKRARGEEEEKRGRGGDEAGFRRLTKAAVTGGGGDQRQVQTWLSRAGQGRRQKADGDRAG